MLSFEEKLMIIESFPELTRKNVSLGRVNFHFEESTHEKKLVVQHLHPNGNGFVYAGHLNKKDTDRKGFINIRDYSAEQLRELVSASIAYLSQSERVVEEKDAFEYLEGIWVRGSQELSLLHEDLLWNVYAGENLEECFESPVEAERYLEEEGFKKARKA